MKILRYIAVLCLCTVAGASVKFPYPQTKAYGNNTIIANPVSVCSSVSPSTQLKNQFLNYLSNYYTESGNYARIKFDDPSYTVSEGIGYGMIFMVYFSDNTTSYQSQFDKLWAYYQNYSDGNGLMHWKIQDFNSVNQSGSATDADEDVAFALAMAYYQWGDSKYQSAAASLIAKIRSNDFNSDGMHKPGDQWDSYKNPSYVSPAAYEIFKLFDSGNSSFWSSAISKNYTLLQSNQNSSTGLPSGWCNSSGQPQNGNNSFVAFDYDASRAPWRWAWSYAWYGHSQANSLLSKLSTWVNSKLVTQLKINMCVDGSTNCGSSSIEADGTSIGSLSSTLIYSSSYQDKLNSNFQSLLLQNPGYYHSSLRLLTGLLMTGNFQNLATATPITPSSSSSSLPEECQVSSSSAYVNSGAYGWNSETVELSEEAADGVKMGNLIGSASRRWVTKVLGTVSAGVTYTVSFQLCEDAGGEAQDAHFLINSSGDICDYKYDLSGGACVQASCTYTSGSTQSDTLNLWLWDWGGVFTVSDLLAYSDRGDTLISGMDSWAKFTNRPEVFLSNDGAHLVLSAYSDVSLLDVQGRVIRNFTAKSGSAAISFNGISKGFYMISIRSALGNKVYRVQVK